MTDSEPKPTEPTPTPENQTQQPEPSGPSVPAPPPEAAAETPQPAPAAMPSTAETPVAPPTQTATQPVEQPPQQAKGLHWGTGRRKSAIARVRLMPGSGNFTVNKRAIEHYFTEPQDRADIVAPLELTGVRKNWDVFVNVHGGGHTGQAGAIKLGLARAMVKAYEQFEPTLRDAGYLTRDARRVERKKPGQRKARRRFQFSKR